MNMPITNAPVPALALAPTPGRTVRACATARVTEATNSEAAPGESEEEEEEGASSNFRPASRVKARKIASARRMRPQVGGSKGFTKARSWN